MTRDRVSFLSGKWSHGSRWSSSCMALGLSNWYFSNIPRYVLVKEVLLAVKWIAATRFGRESNLQTWPWLSSPTSYPPTRRTVLYTSVLRTCLHSWTAVVHGSYTAISKRLVSRIAKRIQHVAPCSSPYLIHPHTLHPDFWTTLGGTYGAGDGTVAVYKDIGATGGVSVASPLAKRSSVSKMNRLVLAVGVLCLLQGAFANPRPDFGVQPTIPVSATVNLSFVDAFGEVNDITNLALNTSLQFSYSKLTAVFTALQNVVGQVTTLSAAFKYQELFTVQNGTTLAFANILTPIDNMVTYIQNTSATAIITPLKTATQYTGITDELEDEFGRLALGLISLKAELQAVKTSLESAIAANGNSPAMSAATLAIYLKSAAVYKLVRAINRVKAYLPVITYTLDTVYENLLEADFYIKSLQADLDSLATGSTADYSGAYKISSDAVEQKTSSNVTAALGASAALHSQLGTISNFTATTNSSIILTKLNALATKSLTASNGLLHTEFNTTLYAIKDFISSKVASVNASTDPNVQTLIDVLMGNNKGFGRYCYHKYKYLITNLFDNGVNSGFECTDKEDARLKNLQSIIDALLVQIAYDTEEVSAQISLCAGLPTAGAEACVASVSGYYSSLFDATASKIDALYTFVTKEAIASRNRVLICFALSYYQLSGSEAAAITSNVLACAANGPSGTTE